MILAVGLAIARNFNYYESLSGIETLPARFYTAATPKFQLLRIPIRDWNIRNCQFDNLLCKISITTNPYQGLKLGGRANRNIIAKFQLLRIPIKDWNLCLRLSEVTEFYFNYYESLSGIETTIPRLVTHKTPIAITTNPYQGLKRRLPALVLSPFEISITTNPYQGLKHQRLIQSAKLLRRISITTNPYQGLK